MKIRIIRFNLLLILALFMAGCSANAAAQDDVPVLSVETLTVVEQSPALDPTPDSDHAPAEADQQPIDDQSDEVTVSELDVDQIDEENDDVARPENWGENSHSNKADPNYDVVFPNDQVNRIDITVDPADWQVMLDDMSQLYGEMGTQRAAGPAPNNDEQNNGAMPPPPAGQQAGGMPPAQGAPAQQGGPAGQGPRMGGMQVDENPVWVPVTVEFEGNSWTNVGLRFKGNSSLKNAWSNGKLKLPFKLDFDEFEDEYPEIDDQRFYGFKQLMLSSNFNDSSYLREKVTADIMREAGIPAAHTAFYQLYVDYGEGPVYFGLYTLVEVVDDTVIEQQFEDDSGNVYKPEGAGANFVQGTFSERGFDKQTNEDEADWSDIQALFEDLHSDQRLADPAAWRDSLESVFDVDTFLKWLAVNTVIQNWDSYGRIAHNYYLYNDPSTGLLTWIPWDHNEALYEGKMRGAVSLSLDEVGTEWPLIRYLMDDAVYHAQYVSYVEETIIGVFSPEKMTATYQSLHNLIQPYVTGDQGENPEYSYLRSDNAFEDSLTELIQHVNDRYTAATAYIQSQP